MLASLDFLKLQKVKKSKELAEKLHLKKKSSYLLTLNKILRKNKNLTYENLKSYKSTASPPSQRTNVLENHRKEEVKFSPAFLELKCFYFFVDLCLSSLYQEGNCSTYLYFSFVVKTILNAQTNYCKKSFTNKKFRSISSIKHS